MKSIFEQSEEIVKELFNQGYESWGQQSTRTWPCDAPIIGIKCGQSVMSRDLKKGKSIVTICYIYNKIKDNILRYDADSIHIYYEDEKKLICLKEIEA